MADKQKEKVRDILIYSSMALLIIVPLYFLRLYIIAEAKEQDKRVECYEKGGDVKYLEPTLWSLGDVFKCVDEDGDTLYVIDAR